MIYRRIIRRASQRSAHRQSGYALLMVVFFASILLIGTMSIGLRTLTEGRREKEQDMIWRGKQYTRGIKLYYRKLGRFPQSMDDLTKPKIGNLRFMRQPYTDPMNKDDGSWRFIYVGPAGQLIGSLNPKNNTPLGGTSLFGQNGSTPGSTSSFGSGTFGSSGPGTQSPAPGSQTTGFGFGSSTQTNPGAPGTPPGVNGTPGAPGTGTTTATDTGTGTGATGTDSQAALTGDTPTIVGGNIIGVGSKINKSSIIVYEQADNYRLFEFIWNPAKDMGAALGLAPGGPMSGTPGQGPTGFGSGTPGTGQPGTGQPGQGQPGQGGQSGFPVNPNPQLPPTSNPNQ